MRAFLEVSAGNVATTAVMDYYELINRRRMVRNFTDESIEADVIDRIVTAGLQGPSAGFSQGFEFLVLSEADEREAFWDCNEHNPQAESIRTAPLVVVPFACKDAYLDRYAEPDKGWTDRDEARWPVPYWYIDTGMAAMHILLAAVVEDLGALFFGIPREDWPVLRSTFAVPDEYDPIGAIAIGHPAETRVPSSATSRDRRSTDAVIHRGTWQSA